jgi:hypothetical protein
MNTSDLVAIVAMFCVLTLGLHFLGYCRGRNDERERIQVQAIANGVATYDEQGRFKWKQLEGESP